MAYADYGIDKYDIGTGFGHFGIAVEDDAIELDQLINYLINKEESEGVVLLGHSTGCQNIVYYMRTNVACSRAVRAAIFRVRRLQLHLTEKESAINVPMNLDAHRRITFFTNSLFMNMPKAPKVHDMQSFRLVSFTQKL
ncbi:hypothetical protein U1Q18_043096 [Sarracenia purpurea var. burkii]